MLIRNAFTKNEKPNFGSKIGLLNIFMRPA